VQKQGAAIVICPSTEANLGDGVFDFTGYASLGGHWSIGSDSHVTRCWSEELRALEYAQRLTHRQRNVAAQYSGRDNTPGSTAATLFEAALRGGHAATGQALGGLGLGQRADFVVLDTEAPALLGIPDSHLLDALVFSSPDARPQAVFVAGRAVATQVQGALASNFVQTMQALWR
jgi:formimidoylglutamate deiminase